MALRKREIEDSIEVVGELRDLQVRTTIIVEEGTESKGYTELSRNHSRVSYRCVKSEPTEEGGWVHTDTDTSEMSTEVQAVANAVWTDEVKALVKTTNEASAL